MHRPDWAVLSHILTFAMRPVPRLAALRSLQVRDQSFLLLRYWGATAPSPHTLTTRLTFPLPPVT